MNLTRTALNLFGVTLVSCSLLPARAAEPRPPIPLDRFTGNDLATYRLCYLRGPEGILLGLAQELQQNPPRPLADQ